MAKLFKTAFAYQGTKEQLPDDAQPDGKASFAEGFTDDYTLDYGDADARDIAQSELNGILHDITEAVGELQKYGVAVWQSDITPIAKYSLVFHGDKLWQAKKNTSATPTAGADWQHVDIADIVSQLGTLDLTDYATKTYVDNSVSGLASVSYVDAGLASKATASVVNAQLAGKLDKTDVVQDSGQSTTKVMSQKAVTDAISDAAAGQLSWGAITGDIETQDDLQGALNTRVPKPQDWGDGDKFLAGDGTLKEAQGEVDLSEYATKTELAAKVDKVAGKGLSDTNFSQAEKDKLAGLESSKYKGQYTSLVDLQNNVNSPTAGDYADVDLGVGSSVVRYIYDADDSEWIEQVGASTQLTGAQVKQMYEAQPDTNAYTDSEKSKLAGIADNATKNDSDANLKNRANHTGTQAHTTITGLGSAATRDVGDNGNGTFIEIDPSQRNFSHGQLVADSSVVIALCSLDNTNISLDSGWRGEILSKRANGNRGISSHQRLNLFKQYNSTKMAGSIEAGLSFHNSGIWEPCTFTKDGNKYGGIAIKNTASPTAHLKMKGYGTFTPILYTYQTNLNTTPVITDQEIYDSISFDDFVNFKYIKEVMHEGNLNTGTGSSQITVMSQKAVTDALRPVPLIITAPQTLVQNQPHVVYAVETDAMTFPENPTAGDKITLIDSNEQWDVTNVTLTAASGTYFYSNQSTFTLDLKNSNPTFIYISPTRGWQII